MHADCQVGLTDAAAQGKKAVGKCRKMQEKQTLDLHFQLSRPQKMQQLKNK